MRSGQYTLCVPILAATMILVNDNDVVTRPTCVIMDSVIMNVICVVVLWWGVSTSTTVWAQEYFMILGHHQVATDMKLPDGREWKLLLLNCLCRLIGDSVTHQPSMNQWQQLLVTGGRPIYGLERSFVIVLLLLLLMGVFFFVVVFLPSRFLPLLRLLQQQQRGSQRGSVQVKYILAEWTFWKDTSLRFFNQRYDQSAKQFQLSSASCSSSSFYLSFCDYH